MFFALGKEAKNTVNGLTGVDGVQCAENEVTGFRRHQRDLHCRAIAHFAHQNDFRRLAQRRAQTSWDNC